MAGCPCSLPSPLVRRAPVTLVGRHGTTRDVTLFTSSLRSGNMRRSATPPQVVRTAWPERRDRQGGASRCHPGDRVGSRGVLIAPLQPRRLSQEVGRVATVPRTRVPKTADAAPPPVAVDAASVPCSVPLVVRRHRSSALGLAQTSPDSVRLTDAQCVFETRLAHGTCGADGLGLLFPTQLLALALEVRRRKEDGCLRAAARGSHLPIFLDALCTHRHTPLPGRTIQPVLTRNKGKFRCGVAPGHRRCPRSTACKRRATATCG